MNETGYMGRIPTAKELANPAWVDATIKPLFLCPTPNAEVLVNGRIYKRCAKCGGYDSAVTKWRPVV